MARAQPDVGVFFSEWGGRRPFTVVVIQCGYFRKTPRENMLDQPVRPPGSIRRWDLTIALPIVSALMLLLTISGAVYLHFLADQTSELREQSSQRLILIDKLVNALRTAEGAQRSYAITELKRYIEPYESAKRQAQNRLVELKHRYAKNAEAGTLLLRLSGWQENRLAELDELFEVQQKMGVFYVRLMVVEDRGRTHMNQIEIVVQELQQLETATNTALSETLRKRRQDTVTMGIALYLVVTVAGWIMFASLRRERRARQKLADQMEHDAFHDGLTGLPNRRYFLDHLSRSVTRVQRRTAVLGVLFIDLDGFKRVNDELGHQAGDRVLQLAAERFASVVRRSDLLARLGGDEFAVVFEPEEARPSLALAHRLLESLRAPLLPAHPTYLIGASIGVAFCPVDAAEPDLLLALADKAMYDAKRNGKNNVRRHGLDASDEALEQQKVLES